VRWQPSFWWTDVNISTRCASEIHSHEIRTCRGATNCRGMKIAVVLPCHRPLMHALRLTGRAAGFSLDYSSSSSLAGHSVRTPGTKRPWSKPHFKIADIHTSSNLSSPKVQGGGLHSGQYELREATMLDLIVTAYGVDPDTVFGGPALA